MGLHEIVCVKRQKILKHYKIKINHYKKFLKHLKETFENTNRKGNNRVAQRF